MKQTPKPENPNKPRNLSEVQFKYSGPLRNEDVNFTDHRLSASNKDNHHIGSISWDSKTGVIRRISTHPDFRGLGVATTLLERATKLSQNSGIKEPQQSKKRTALGEKWSQSLNQPLPERSCYQCGKVHSPEKFNHNFYPGEGVQ